MLRNFSRNSDFSLECWCCPRGLTRVGHGHEYGVVDGNFSLF